jgi:hypothetical protein
MSHQRRPRSNRHYRIDHELSPADREAYLAYLREPRTTNKSAHAWLVARGYATFSESAVARHKRFYLERFAADVEAQARTKQWAMLASETKSAGGDIVGGAVALSEVMLFRKLMDGGDRGLSKEELFEYGRLVSRLVQTRVAWEKLKLASPVTSQGASAQRPSAVPSEPPDPAMTEAQRHEMMIQKACEILRVPYHTAEERAASAREREEFERRQAAQPGMPGNN